MLLNYLEFLNESQNRFFSLTGVMSTNTTLVVSFKNPQELRNARIYLEFTKDEIPDDTSFSKNIITFKNVETFNFELHKKLLIIFKNTNTIMFELDLLAQKKALSILGSDIDGNPVGNKPYFDEDPENIAR